MTDAEKALLEAALNYEYPEDLPDAREIALRKARDAVRRERIRPGLLEETKQAWFACHRAEKQFEGLRAACEANGVRITGELGMIATEWYEEAQNAAK